MKNRILIQKFLMLVAASLLSYSQLLAQSSAYNYIVTYTPRVPVTAANTLQTATVANVNQVVQYFDALGRPIQTVQTKASPTQRDIVRPMAYDQFDREAVKYPPYTDSVNSSNYGTYKTTAISDQASFYANPTSAKWNAPGVVTTPYPTGATKFEASPLDRPLEQGFAGDNWQLAGTVGPTNPGHTIKMLYATNDASSLTTGDGYWARLYTVTFSYPSGSYDYRNSLSTSGKYPANTLYVTVSKNENWSASQSDTTLNTTQEYKDLFGRVVLKRTINYNTSTSSREVMSTYYVYDEYNNLVYVLPPMANPDAGAITQPQLDNYCYQYRYDGRNRMIYKKIPGKGWEFMVYNNLNQVIATQDSVQRMKSPQQVWYHKYDSQGRMIATGVYSLSGTITAGTDDWSALQAAANAQTVNWETKSASGVYSSVTIPTSGVVPLVTNYYDDYNVSGIPYTVSSGVSVMTRGMLTVSQPSILNNPGYFMWTVHYYDDWGRDIKTYRMHFLGGTADDTPNNYDLVATYYNFANQVDTTIRKHYTKANTTTPKVIVNNFYTYDQVGRRLTNTEQITGMNGVAQPAVTLSSTTYNQIGQLRLNNVGNSLQTISYGYNERGWLTSLTPSVSAPGGGNYAETIYYNNPTGTATPQYNGNISQFAYNSPHMEAANGVHIPTATNMVSYTYDNLNRLTKSQSTLAATDETVTSDLQGNINSLVRSGTGVNTGTFGYTYAPGTNRVASVTENSASFKQYSYDGNGNVTADSATKRLNYNVMDLPTTFTVNGTTKATYYYDERGSKVKDVSIGYGTWDYIDGIVYLNENINFIQTEQGRAALWADSLYHYSYDLKDYLGNVRASYADSTNALQIVQENDYYPFGLTVKTYDFANGNRYLYNGKEEQLDLTNQYDFGARFYNPIVARWMRIDPLAEKYPSASPYVFTLNNPIRHVDLNGKDVILKVIRDKNGKLKSVEVSSTVYITGDGASDERASELTDAAADVFKPGKSNGVKVSFNVTYKYSKNKKSTDLKAGENLLVFSALPEHDSDNDKSKINRSEATSAPDAAGNQSGGDNVGTIYSSGKSNHTIFHETGHLMGLDDQYVDHDPSALPGDDFSRSDPAPGYETDLMASEGFDLNKDYYKSYVQEASFLLRFNPSDDFFTPPPLINNSSEPVLIPFSGFINSNNAVGPPPLN